MLFDVDMDRREWRALGHAQKRASQHLPGVLRDVRWYRGRLGAGQRDASAYRVVV